MSDPACIAILDDDRFLREALDNLIRSAGLCARSFDSAESFLAQSDGQRFAVLLVDFRMPGRSGLELVRTLRRRGDETPVVIMSADDDPSLEQRACESGATAFLLKPFEPEMLLALIERTIRRRRSDRNGSR